MKDINIQNAGMGNVINQINLSVSEKPIQQSLSDLGVTVKETHIVRNFLIDVFGLASSICAILEFLGLRELLTGSLQLSDFLNFSPTECRFRYGVSFIALIFFAIFLVRFRENCQLFLHLHNGNHFRDKENRKAYYLKMTKCPKCARKAKLCIRELGDSRFEFFCSACGNKIIVSYDDIFRFSEESLRAVHQTDNQENQ